MKTKLARHLGVPPQRIRDWLAGERFPGGETALQLLEWVTAEEAKQNTAAGARTPTAAKRTRSNCYEQTTSPKEKRYSKTQ
jgi:hypothetical protein